MILAIFFSRIFSVTMTSFLAGLAMLVTSLPTYVDLNILSRLVCRVKGGPTDRDPSGISCRLSPGQARGRAVYTGRSQWVYRWLWMRRCRRRDWPTESRLATWADLRCLNWRRR